MQYTPMPLDDGTLYILDTLRAAGYGANVVGGAVRNHLLGIPVTDIDITTSATPEQTKAAFSHLRVIETGIKHGTVTVLLDGTPYEITTYRADGEYLDNRHPSSVSFTTTLAEDLSRRDFTVNAICYNPTDGYTDLFGGIDDIRARIIRAVGEPETRFKEDALRIMRAIRFASVLGFDVDPATATAVHACRSLLDNVSRERIYTEWIKLLGGVGAYAILSEYSDVISAAIPALSSLTLPSKKGFEQSDVLTRQLALFYLSTPDPVCDFADSMRILHTDNETRIVGKTALSILSSVDPDRMASLLLSVYENGRTATTLAVKLGVCIDRFAPTALDNLRAALSSDVPTSVSDLRVNGAELAALGLRGPAIGAALDRLIRAVIAGECKNEREALITLSRTFITI